MDTNFPRPEKITFKDIVRHPLVYALIIITSLLWIFVFQVSQSHNTTLEAKDSEIVRLTQDVGRLEQQLTKERTEKDNLYKALLVKNGVISELSVRIDSINHNKASYE